MIGMATGFGTKSQRSFQSQWLVHPKGSERTPTQTQTNSKNNIQTNLKMTVMVTTQCSRHTGSRKYLPNPKASKEHTEIDLLGSDLI